MKLSDGYEIHRAKVSLLPRTFVHVSQVDIANPFGQYVHGWPFTLYRIVNVIVFSTKCR